jgi:hypothetical protein
MTHDDTIKQSLYDRISTLMDERDEARAKADKFRRVLERIRDMPMPRFNAAALDGLVQGRLLVAHEVDGTTAYQLAHEALRATLPSAGAGDDDLDDTMTLLYAHYHR